MLEYTVDDILTELTKELFKMEEALNKQADALSDGMFHQKLSLRMQAIGILDANKKVIETKKKVREVLKGS